MARLSWRGLTFEPNEAFTVSEGLALRGDQALTLGFDAGLIIDIPASIRGSRVRSNNPQAIGIGDDRFVGGPIIYTRLYAAAAGEGRLVWMDFAPHFEDHSSNINIDYFNALIASIFRYLLKKPHSSLAMWPHGRSFAGLIEQDTEDQYTNAEKVAALVRRKGFPITWFILSNLAQKHRALTIELSETGEVACHGDSHLPFTKSDHSTQIVRIARCRKVLEEITGKAPYGFRPPEEKFDRLTLDAVYNNGMSYILGEAGTDRVVPRLLAAGDYAQLVSIPRAVYDDFNLWVDSDLNLTESRELIENQLKWISTLGGIYVLSFHSQMMGDADHIGIVDYTAQELLDRKAFFATASDIAQWWRVRADLISGKTVDHGLIERYGPVSLSVTADGELVRKPLMINHGGT